jgi:glutamyl-tRNA synthetase
MMDAKELSRYVGFADEEIGELARIYIEDDISTTHLLRSKIDPIFETRNIPTKMQKEVTLLKDTIIAAPYFDEYSEFCEYLVAQTQLPMHQIEKPLRVLLTNTQEGPEMEKIYSCLKNYIGEIIK